MYDLNDVFKELSDVKENGKINVYALKYTHTLKSDNFAIALPSNQNTEFLRRFCDSLDFYKEFECKKYDPIEKIDGAYEFLPIDHISTVWDDMSSMILGSCSLKGSSIRDLLPAVNLTICELEYGENKLWLGTRQEKTEVLFKGKFPFLATESKLVSIDLDKILALAFRIDFIVSDNGEGLVIYIFNRGYFEKIFNYYDLLKQHVRSRSSVIEGWAFLENPSFIQEQLETRYVFRELARIIDDAEYLEQVKNTKPHMLKARLLEKCPDAFSEKDFDDDKLYVTKSSLRIIIKMISKGFKYNFFADKAEAR